MRKSPIIRCEECNSLIADQENLCILDCRFTLSDKSAGYKAYLEGHIPGAIYADLEQHLSDPAIPGITGRHPLPAVDEIAITFGRWGIGENTHVIVYDENAGGMAARAWWLLRWLGHDNVQLLSGGWQAWIDFNGAVEKETPRPVQRDFLPEMQADWLMSSQEILASLDDPKLTILDARDSERYRGEIEPIDAVAGHIPGARSVPYRQLVDASGQILPVELVRAKMLESVGDTLSKQTVCYCGSGVTAAFLVLALEYAGLPPGKLYAGSWSEWITDSSRPVATGEDPSRS